ncbi:MAG: FAD-dependent oxidoreductase, partial [Tateyamaria sp.]
MTLNRRTFLGTSAVAAATLAAPMVRAQGKPRVVVVGGGAGGATAARYIAKDSKGDIDVTLIEPTRTYYTCFFSNLYLGGFKTIDEIGHSYGGLAANGVNVVHDWAVGVDRDAKTVTLAGGGTRKYDKLVLSPGIDFVDMAATRWGTPARKAKAHRSKKGTHPQSVTRQRQSTPAVWPHAPAAPP